MIDELNRSLSDYYHKWQVVTNGVPDFASYKPVAVGWKVVDKAEYQAVYAQLKEQCDRIVETWMNGRWIAEMHLKDASLEGGITLIKLMQRRPESTDALGLDHVDFLCSSAEQMEAKLQESQLQWSRESNDVIDNYSWISVWFDGAEAKIKESTVIDIVIKELQQINEQIKR